MTTPPRIDVAALVDAMLPKGYQPHMRDKAIEIAQAAVDTQRAAVKEAEPVAHVAGDEAQRYLMWSPKVAAFDYPVGTPVYATQPPPTPASVPEFSDERVQSVYRLLCDDAAPQGDEHWEGFVARRIVAALFPTPASVPVVEREALRKCVDVMKRMAVIVRRPTMDPEKQTPANEATPSEIAEAILNGEAALSSSTAPVQWEQDSQAAAKEWLWRYVKYVMDDFRMNLVMPTESERLAQIRRIAKGGA